MLTPIATAVRRSVSTEARRNMVMPPLSQEAVALIKNFLPT